MSHRYTSTIKVIKDHLDDLNHVNNVQYLLWAQDIAKAHWQKINEIIKDEGVWMVRTHQVEYRLGAFLNDEIRIETHVNLASRKPINVSTKIKDLFLKEKAPF